MHRVNASNALLQCGPHARDGSMCRGARTRRPGSFNVARTRGMGAAHRRAPPAGVVLQCGPHARDGRSGETVTECACMSFNVARTRGMGDVCGAASAGVWGFNVARTRGMGVGKTLLCRTYLASMWPARAGWEGRHHNPLRSRCQIGSFREPLLEKSQVARAARTHRALPR